MEPIELGINMNSNSENDEVLFGDEFNLNYFGITTGNNIMAWEICNWIFVACKYVYEVWANSQVNQLLST